MLAACRAAIDGSRDFVLAEIDWRRFMALCRRHRVQGFVHAGLPTLKVVPPDAEAHILTTDTTKIVAGNLGAIAESARILNAFHGSGIAVLFVKGMALAGLVHPKPLLKMSSDIDLLVDPAELPAAAGLLGDLGYRSLAPRTGVERWHEWHKESVWSNGRQQIDLHTGLADNDRLIPGIGLASPMQQVSLPGGVTLPTLATDELFAYLCVHGASSAWFRLKWILDLAALLRNRPAEEVDRLFERSQALGAGRSAGQALLLVSELFGTSLSSALAKRLVDDRPVRLLATLARKQMSGKFELGEPAAIRFGTAAIHASQLLLLPGLRFKAGEIFRQGCAAIRAAGRAC
ncbi:MAG TPA: nucleotidyltransferase family protein [Sphingomicrobium sp.]|nr:nucleotidyltransferase family protein [Sphingomicrobium sp.]